MMFAREEGCAFKIISSGNASLIGLVGICTSANGPKDGRRLDLVIYRAGRHMVVAYGIPYDDVRPV